MSSYNELKDEPVVVIYHSGCYDGFCAAWIFWRQFPKAEFVPANYGDDPPDVRGKSVFVVDFSYPRETLLRMNEESSSLVVLDHHRTAQKDLEGLDFCTFDMTKSGGRLAWEFIYGTLKTPNWPIHRQLKSF